ncbi:hypothetical protein N657DRAFT_644769 [Parathielavia appendiculata]|uniref:Uncharacterized protein n=1 Tax=Parathielavia appendiculata TaxID=2587402 RepID=A0AAN6U1B8_9PEZI|nr:hypothetical protein N657DRAFT_644769 [Parathielavia appendiculata]
MSSLSRVGATDHCVTPSKEGPWFELSSRTRSCAHGPHTVTTRDTRSAPLEDHSPNHDSDIRLHMVFKVYETLIELLRRETEHP